MIILHRHLLVVTYVCNDTSQLTLINAGVGGMRNHHHHPSENRVFSATEHQMWSSRKKRERSICLGLVVAARQSCLGRKFLNLKILNFLLLPQNFTTNQGLNSKLSHPTARTAYQCAYAKEMR